MDEGDVLPKRRSVSREGTAALRGRPSSATILSMTWAQTCTACLTFRLDYVKCAVQAQLTLEQCQSPGAWQASQLA